MVLEPRILLDASLVDTTSIEADPEQPTDLQFDVPGTRVSDPQDPQRMITPDLPTIRNWLDTANTHNARLSIVVKLWDAQPEDRISLAETYSSSSVLRDTWDDARGELRLEPRAGAASPAVAEAFLDALQALQLEASGAEDVSTREVWVFPTLAGASEVAYRVERSSGMVRHYVLDASLESYADARKTAEQQRFFGVDGYLGHFSSDAEKSVYGSMAQGRPLWLGLSDKRQRRGLEGVEWSEGRSGFLAGDRCRRRNIWLRRAEFRLTGLRLGRCRLGEVVGNERLPTKSVFGVGFSRCVVGRG